MDYKYNPLWDDENTFSKYASDEEAPPIVHPEHEALAKQMGWTVDYGSGKITMTGKFGRPEGKNTWYDPECKSMVITGNGEMESQCSISHRLGLTSGQHHEDHKERGMRYTGD